MSSKTVEVVVSMLLAAVFSVRINSETAKMQILFAMFQNLCPYFLSLKGNEPMPWQTNANFATLE